MKKNISLLVVDDDEDDFILLKSYLEDLKNYHFSFQWTPDYNSALEHMRQNKHDVVVIDYLMGSHTGLELLKAAVQAGCRMPVIVLTGQCSHKDKKKSSDKFSDVFSHNKSFGLRKLNQINLTW